MISKSQDVVAFDQANVPVLKSVLDQICNEAVTFRYSTASPTKMDNKEVVIVDDGASLKRLYVKSAQGRLLYVALT